MGRVLDWESGNHIKDLGLGISILNNRNMGPLADLGRQNGYKLNPDSSYMLYISWVLTEILFNE